MPKEKPQVNIGEVIKTYRSQRGLSQGDIERRTGLLRCYLSRVENGHTVPSLETLAKIAEAMDISLADFFPGTETPRDKETQKMLGELSQDEIRFLVEIKRGRRPQCRTRRTPTAAIGRLGSIRDRESLPEQLAGPSVQRREAASKRAASKRWVGRRHLFGAT